jgi:hypothetical protein
MSVENSSDGLWVELDSIPQLRYQTDTVTLLMSYLTLVQGAADQGLDIH